MGKRGPLPTQAATQQLHGNPGGRPLKTRTPPDLGTPSMPTSLSPLGVALWKELTGELRKLKALTTADKRLLEAACLSYEEMRAAAESIAANGTTYTSSTPTGVIVRPRPEVQQRSDAFRRFTRCLSDLGLTPGARIRLQTPVPVEDDDPFAEFMRPQPQH